MSLKGAEPPFAAPQPRLPSEEQFSVEMYNGFFKQSLNNVSYILQPFWQTAIKYSRRYMRWAHIFTGNGVFFVFFNSLLSPPHPTHMTGYSHAERGKKKDYHCAFYISNPKIYYFIFFSSDHGNNYCNVALKVLIICFSLWISPQGTSARCLRFLKVNG